MRPTALVAVAAPLLFAGRAVPKFEPDPFWPTPLPNNWMLGHVSGIFVDAHDHIWDTNRLRSLEGHDKYAADGTADCCVASAGIRCRRQPDSLRGRARTGLCMARQRARSVCRLQGERLDRPQRRQGHQYSEVHQNREVPTCSAVTMRRSSTTFTALRAIRKATST